MQKYYVYYHKFTNNKYYVGKGCGSRISETNHRSILWKELASLGYSTHYYAENLSEEDALALELDIINQPLDWELINVSKSNTTLNLDKTYFDQYVKYNPDSPSGLSWVVPINSGIPIGSPAGGKLKRGYWGVTINGKRYLAHRIIWCLIYGTLDPDMVINHIDNNPSNNLISNLECCTKADNNRSMKMHTGNGLNCKNTSGINGVTEYTTGKYVYAKVSWNDPATGKQKCKTFSYTKYGKEAAWNMAIEYRKNTVNTTA